MRCAPAGAGGFAVASDGAAAPSARAVANATESVWTARRDMRVLRERGRRRKHAAPAPGAQYNGPMETAKEPSISAPGGRRAGGEHPTWDDFEDLVRFASPVVVVQVGLMAMGVVDTIVLG